MPFRPDLDLTEIIAPYKPFIEGRRPPEHPDSVALHEAKSIPLDERRITPALSVVGYGPITCSTNTDLVVQPQHSWDVSGYYKALGVHWKADRKALRLAYQQKNGQSSGFLTYVLRLLLDPVKRRAYDMTPLGEEFIDEWREREIKDRAKREAAKRAAREGRETTDEDKIEVLKEQGFTIVPDDVGGSEEDAPTQFHTAWGYSYYVSEISCYDTDRLELWQQMIISEYSRRGIKTIFAVGFIGGDKTYFTREEKGGIVTHYLGGTTKPTEQLAADLINTHQQSDQQKTRYDK